MRNKGPLKKFHLELSTETIIYCSLSALLFLYILHRAIFVPMVNDEVTTFFRYVQMGKFLPFRSHLDANNHFLNSALTFLSYKIFGDSELSLRLPNVLSSLVFFYYIFKLSLHFSDRYLKWIFIISMITAGYFLEFFANSRGYGLSMAFMTAALYHLLSTFENGRLVHYYYCYAFLALAILANGTLLVTSLLVIGLTISKVLLSDTIVKAKRKVFVAALVVLGLLPILLTILILLKLQRAGLLYYGEDKEFWTRTLGSLVNLLTGNWYSSVKIMIGFYFILAVTMIAYVILRKKQWLFFIKKDYAFFILLTGNVIANLILNRFFGVKLPLGRTGLFYFPLFIGAVLFSFNLFIKDSPVKMIKYLTLPLLAIPVHLVMTANFNVMNDNPFEYFPRKYFNLLQSEAIISGHCTIAGTNLNSNTYKYMNYRNGGTLNHMQNSGYGNNLTDYIITARGQSAEAFKDYFILESDAKTDTKLLSRIKRYEGYKQVKETEILPTGLCNKGVLYLDEILLDSLTGKSLSFDLDFTVLSETVPLNCWVVLEMKDNNDKTLLYDAVELNQKQLIWDGTQSNFTDRYVYIISPEAKMLDIHVYNPNKLTYEIKGGRIMVTSG